MDKNTIEVNFQEAMASADELDGIANELERVLKNEYAESQAQLYASWSGANADFYRSKSTKLTEQIQDSVSRIHTAASEIRSTARWLRNAELAALAIAGRRDY
ncbi:MAG: WXG100 family type VII secretion target [Clostridiales bacterium]|nr:WXG100 family type VII secretion target [Clostridiales bacterium]